MKIVLVEKEEFLQRCHQCGVIADTRPYGLHHEEICYDCAAKDPTLTTIRSREIFPGLNHG
jgi:hypothetical protein